MNREVRGLCACGCGEPTRQVEKADKVRGLERGDYNLFLHGHYHRLKRQSDSKWGTHYRRLKRRDQVFRELVVFLTPPKLGGGPIGMYRFQRIHARDFSVNALCRMAHAVRRLGYPTRSFKASFWLWNGNVSPWLQKGNGRKHKIKPKVPKVFKTLLVDRSNIRALDKAISIDSLTNFYAITPSTEPDPCQALMDKEEAESPETIQRQKDITRFEKWRNKVIPN